MQDLSKDESMYTIMDPIQDFSKEESIYIPIMDISNVSLYTWIWMMNECKIYNKLNIMARVTFI